MFGLGREPVESLELPCGLAAAELGQQVRHRGGSGGLGLRLGSADGHDRRGAGLDVVADLDEPLHVLRTYLPAISSHISAQADAALQGFIEADVVRAVRFAETRMSSLRIKADDVEALLPSDQEFTERSYKLGLVLYHPFRECIWADDFHLPVRVGEVVPVMARRLLSENGKGTR